jgi:hypothetical protein
MADMRAQWWRALLPGLLLAGAGLLRAEGAPAQPDAESLAWLGGCWQLESAGRRVREQWMPPDGGTLFGMSRTVKDGKVLEFEYVRIEPRDGRLHYVAKPSGQPEAAFALVEAGPDHATFENPAHDFPHRIGYRRQADSLLAWIEGTRDGSVRRVEFPYKRVRCE